MKELKMKNVSNKKSIIRAAVISAMLLASSSTLSALEFGGVVNNSTKLKTNTYGEFKFDQTDIASLWFKAPFIKSKKVNCYLSGQTSYSFERDFDAGENIQYADLDLLKFVYSRNFKTCSVEIDAGRYATYDLSGYIFGQKADGFNFGFKSSAFEVNIFGAYTGLLNSKVDTMLDHNLVKLSSSSEALYDLAEKNLVGIAYIKFPRLFLRQDVTVQGIGTMGLEDTIYERGYLTLNLSGPLSTMVYYNLCSTLGATCYDTEDTQLGNLTSIAVTVFPPVLNSSIVASAVYASGNQGILKPFRGISSMTFCDALNQPEYSGMAKAGLSLTCKPVNSLLISASCDCIFNAAAGDNGDQIEYQGIQGSAGASWQIVSDLMIGLKYSIYYGQADTSLNKQQIAFNACLKF